MLSTEKHQEVKIFHRILTSFSFDRQKAANRRYPQGSMEKAFSRRKNYTVYQVKVIQKRRVSMEFAMRMKLNDEIIKKDSFRNFYINGEKNGFTFDVQLAYYRGHYLSDIDLLEVWLDGKQLPTEAVTFELKGKELPIYKLSWAVTEFWSQVEPAKIRAILPGGVPNGEHELELKLMLRVPYMEIGPNHTFMPLDAGDKVTVKVEETGETEKAAKLAAIGTSPTEGGGIKLGATLFCYGSEYARFQYDFEDCVREAALAGATGYEIVGTQMLPSYPNVSEEFLGLVESLRKKYGIGPVGYGANNDKGMRPDRNLTDDEMLSDAIIDLKTANKLGCHVMRVQYMMSPAAFERLAPYAKLFDVHCGIEIHNPETPAGKTMQEYLAVVKRSGDGYLGFVPDFGFLAVEPNKPKWLKALEAGVKEEHLELAAQLRREGASQEEAMKRVMDAGANPAIADVVAGMFGFVQFHDRKDLPGLLKELRDILPYSFELHGKFHYLGDDGKEASIPYEEILPVVRDFGFNGYLICEYEDEMGCGGTEFTRRQLAMEKKVLGLS